MRVLSIILVACLVLLGPSGCALFNKKPNNDRAGGGEGAVPPPKFPTAGGGTADPTSVNPTSQAPGRSDSMLAGRVLDGFSRPPANTTIRWANLEDKSAQPIDTNVNPEGYFTIPNLKPGKYKLEARGKQGERLVAGTVYASAPNVHILIQVKEEFASNGTPAVPGPLAFQKDDKKEAEAVKNSSANPWTALPTSATSLANEPELSANISVPAPPTATGPSRWTATDGTPPTLEITPPRTVLPIAPLRIPGSKPQPELPSVAPILPLSQRDPARVPSCVLVGNQLVNFALNDINGTPWELQRNKTGKVMLLDFWYTSCAHCLPVLPMLNSLQGKYQTQGLEVIGLANESDGTREQQAYRVNQTCQKRGVGYRQLLDTGVVSKELQVNAFPTLILVNDKGQILWRHQGALNPASYQELERRIQFALTNPLS